MLALTDESLALITIGATALPANERGAWLKDLADRIERDARRARGRKNTRAWRAREAAGMVVIRFAVDEAVVGVGLVQHGFLDPALADSSAALSDAAKRALLELCERSPREREISDTVRTELLVAAARRMPANGAGLPQAGRARAATAARRRGTS